MFSKTDSNISSYKKKINYKKGNKKGECFFKHSPFYNFRLNFYYCFTTFSCFIIFPFLLKIVTR